MVVACDYVVDEAFHHVGGVRLSGVHSRSQNDSRSLSYILCTRSEVSYDEEVAFIAGDGLAERHALQSVFILVLTAQLLYLLLSV